MPLLGGRFPCLGNRPLGVRLVFPVIPNGPVASPVAALLRAGMVADGGRRPE
jgi:hypothetical protein